MSRAQSKTKPSRQARNLLVKFGITEGQYNQLLRKQGGRCAVCKRSSELFSIRLAVDHDHISGEIRGLLCTYCNRYVIGRFRKGFNYFKEAGNYLERDYTGWIVPPKKKRKKRRWATNTRTTKKI